jgi:hypothetical protein
MKVLICHRPAGAFGYITDSWINALCAIDGITVGRWDGTAESWEKFNPDLYCGASGHRQKIPRDRGKCKIAIHVNPYGPIKVEPNINESKDALRWVKSQEPDAVYGYGLEKDREFWSYWDRDGTPWVPMACAGDATLFSPLNGAHDSYDIVYVGGRWAYKAKSMDPYLLPVFTDHSMSHLVYGWGEWGQVMRGVNQATDDEVPGILSSGCVGPCISEPHTIRYGIDVPERVFKVILSGAIAVHDNAKDLGAVLTTVPMCVSPQKYHSTIKKLCSLDGTDRLILAAAQYKQVAKSHTYHHRLAGLLSRLGFEEEAEGLLTALGKFIDDGLQYYNNCS